MQTELRHLCFSNKTTLWITTTFKPTSMNGVDPLTRVPLTRGYFWPEFFWPESHWPEVFWPEDFWPEGSFDQRVYLTRGSIDQRIFWPELLSTRGTQCIIFDQRIKKCISFRSCTVSLGGPTLGLGASGKLMMFTIIHLSEGSTQPTVYMIQLGETSPWSLQWGD